MRGAPTILKVALPRFLALGAGHVFQFFHGLAARWRPGHSAEFLRDSACGVANSVAGCWVDGPVRGGHHELDGSHWRAGYVEDRCRDRAFTNDGLFLLSSEPCGADISELLLEVNG
jgi:hypothetical protein